MGQGPGGHGRPRGRDLLAPSLTSRGGRAGVARGTRSARGVCRGGPSRGRGAAWPGCRGERAQEGAAPASDSGGGAASGRQGCAVGGPSGLGARRGAGVQGSGPQGPERERRRREGRPQGCGQEGRPQPGPAPVTSLPLCRRGLCRKRFVKVEGNIFSVSHNIPLSVFIKERKFPQIAFYFYFLFF